MFRSCVASSAPQSWPAVTMRTPYCPSSELASAAAEGARSVLGAGVLTDGVADHAPSTVGDAVAEGVAGSTVGATDAASVICGDGAGVGISVAVASGSGRGSDWLGCRRHHGIGNDAGRLGV